MGRQFKFFTWISVCVVAIAFALDASAASVNGVFNVVKGDVKVKSGASGQVTPAKVGSKVFPKDTIITGKDSRAKIVMIDKNVINVSPETELVFQQYEYSPEDNKKNVLLNVLSGKVRSKVEQKYDGKTSKFQVKTPGAVAGVRGTDFMASFDKKGNSSNIVTFEGKVEFGKPGPGGSIENPVAVGPGQMASAAMGQAPSAPQPVPPSQLASMDKESNADTAVGAGGGSDSRAPADDKKEGSPSERGDGKQNSEDKSENGEGQDKKDGSASNEKKEGSPSERGDSKQNSEDKGDNGEGHDKKGGNSAEHRQDGEPSPDTNSPSGDSTVAPSPSGSEPPESSSSLEPAPTPTSQETIREPSALPEPSGDFTPVASSDQVAPPPPPPPPLISGTTDPVLLPPLPPEPPPLPPLPPPLPDISTIIQNGTTKVIINVTNGP